MKTIISNEMVRKVRHVEHESKEVENGGERNIHTQKGEVKAESGGDRGNGDENRRIIRLANYTFALLCVYILF
ncbi:hypothetical protein OUZ56_022775 [Daphnia magna]|uniref:Uncharacterized protein n=1 Tax=Daphnia magna TaxID=35525 RepID=A0ABR0AXF4_9CRUS|nr:hypothetical protein OUZ56_022775 [Daphnia magna]